jgi:hypothetical protein
MENVKWETEIQVNFLDETNVICLWPSFLWHPISMMITLFTRRIKDKVVGLPM